MKHDFIALVTGAGQGIGYAIGEAFVRRGVGVVGMDVSVPAQAPFGICKGDVRESSEIRSVVERVIKRYTRVDVLINNAGTAFCKPFLRMNEQEWRRVIDTNLTGTFLMTRAVLPYMLRRNRGVVVNISSIRGRYAAPGMTAYCASKFGIIGFTESLALELASTPLKVYSVLPGGVDTVLSKSIRNARTRYKALLPVVAKRSFSLLAPQEVAQFVVDCALRQRLQSGSKVVIEKKDSKVRTRKLVP